MWIFSRYGFVSAACGSKPDGSIDSDTIMLRARLRDHLANLQQRFPGTELAKAAILDSVGTDYRYRVILSKTEWAEILSELAREQKWSNFKNEAASFARSHGKSTGFVNALNDVWAVMRRLQK